MARAVYSQASTLVLDDVISAVDAQTSQHIIKHCFQSDLVSNRTLVIASHAVEALAPLAQHAVFLEDGTAAWQGKGSDLLNSSFMSHLQTSVTVEDPEAISTALVPASPNSEQLLSAKDFDMRSQEMKTPKQLIQEELQKQGKTDIRLWKQLIRESGGWQFWFGSAVLLISVGVLPVLQRAVLK